MTPTWPEWRDAIFGDPYLVWHEGPTFETLLSADPSEVAVMLPLGLAAADPVAAQSYAALAAASSSAALAVPPSDAAPAAGSGAVSATETNAAALSAAASASRIPPDAVSDLRAALATADGIFAVRCAQALHALTVDASWAAHILPVLASASHWGNRLDAAIALATFPRSPAIISALLSAVEDPEYLVRYHAANSLLHFTGRRSTVDTSRTLFTQISSDDPALWHAAATHLAAKVARS